jgi:cytochrome c peroxidase
VGKASQVDVTAGTPASLDRRCGADGIAVDDRGSVRVWCSFTRSIARFDRTKRGALAKVQHGPALVESNMDATSHSGLVVFHTADENVSAFGGMSCGSCHLDGRSDGVSWHIKTRNLQTPLLAGRIADSAPFKWDGTAKTLERSLRETIGRLGGEGLSKKQLSALAAFVTALPAVRTPTRNPAAIARGKRLFESNEVGCTECHDGPTLGDGARHRFNDVAFDTPGLRGLAASAPYFHDGSAPTLEAVLRERGSVHGMVEAAARLTDAEVADLVAFLEAR